MLIYKDMNKIKDNTGLSKCRNYSHQERINMLETIKKEDCRSRTGKVREMYNVKFNIYKAHHSRGNRRCFNCGTKDPDRGLSWILQIHYLCKSCRDIYEESGE